ncbi:MAG: cyclase family protein [Myxococcota bacterium]
MSRLSRGALVALLLVFCAATAGAGEGSPARRPMIDLTHPFSAKTIYWPTAPAGFVLKELFRGESSGGYFYAANSFCAPEHGGTHLDAPLHFARGRMTVDAISLSRLMGPAFVIDVSEKAARNADYRLTKKDVLAFEAANGRIAAGGMVLLRTGWSRFWPDRKAYLGDDTAGDASKLRFPGYGAGAARFLLQERGVGLIGVDTASVDYGRSKDFIVHQIAAAADALILENLAGLDGLPPRGATIIALPMKIAGGTGAPVRVVGLLPARGEGTGAE